MEKRYTNIVFNVKISQGDYSNITLNVSDRNNFYSTVGMQCKVLFANYQNEIIHNPCSFSFGIICSVLEQKKEKIHYKTLVICSFSNTK